MRLVRIIACLAIAVVVFYMATPIISQFLLQPISPYLPEGTDGLLGGHDSCRSVRGVCDLVSR